MYHACLRSFPRWQSQHFGVSRHLFWQKRLKSILCSHSSAKGSIAVGTRNYISAKMPVASTEFSSLTEPNESSRCCSSSSRRRSFQIIVAATKELGIGLKGKLPWKLPADMAFFKELTTATESTEKMNAVIMGRKTWESLPSKFRPLPHRLNVVLTKEYLSSPEYCPASVTKYSSLDSALDRLSDLDAFPQIERIFVIGGAQIFREAMIHPLCEAIHLTEVKNSFPCDTFIDPVNTGDFSLWRASAPAVDNDCSYSFLTYVRATMASDGVALENIENVMGFRQPDRSGGKKGASQEQQALPRTVLESHEEFQYMNLIRDIIQQGNRKGDRTGTGTASLFGAQMRFNLRHGFPLLTTKRVFWRGVVEELLWFITGCTDARVLQAKGVNIWDGNGSREYLDGIGLQEREVGDLGPVYGFQWRHFGAKYTDMHADYRGQGFDQLADVIEKIKTNPEDRRIILSAWNPSDLALMALPPCHMFCQFYVADGELSCQMYQRSCDMGLGVPFNIASYALLTCIIAHVCGLRAGEFVHVLGDAHVYNNHTEALKEQLMNTPRPFPRLQINAAKKDIDSFEFSDFDLIGYRPHKKIAMKMAV